LHILALAEDREGTVWAGTYARAAGLLCSIRGAEVECFGQDGSLGSGVQALYEDEGDLWVGAASGLWRWKPGPPTRYPLAFPDVQAMIRNDRGDLLVAVHSDVERVVNGRPEPYPVPGLTRELNPKRLPRDRNGGLWIGTTNHGLLLVHQGRAERFARSDGLSGDDVIAIYEDREGTFGELFPHRNEGTVGGGKEAEVSQRSQTRLSPIPCSRARVVLQAGQKSTAAFF
jgi:ligand-binding sensor domain-containing protein